MKYWYYYPKFLQVILLMLMIFTLASFSFAIIGFSIDKLFHVSIESISTLATPQIVNAAIFTQAITSLFTFLLSAVLFSYLYYPEPLKILGLQPVKNINFLIWGGLLMVFAVPIINQLASYVQNIDLGQGSKASFDQQTKFIEKLMSGTSIQQLLLYLLVFAILPAIGEELLFRGIILRFTFQTSNNIHYAVLFSAAVFGLAHGSAYNFIPIVLAGVLLGYLYYYSGSIWVSILGHFINNSIAIFALYLSNIGIVPKSYSDMEHLPWWLIISSILLFVICGIMLRKNKILISPNWNIDNIKTN